MQLSFIKNVDNWIEKNNRWIVLFFFMLFLIVGFSIYRDYGMGFDENFQWWRNGHVNYDFIRTHNPTILLAGDDKYHGPAFEIILVAIEKIFKLTDTRDIFFMRHLLTFLVFFISSVIFYFLSLKLFKNWKLALFGFLFYVLSPHIFSHAFYNSKDSIFLSCFTISIYLLFLFHERQTYFLAFISALAIAFTIDIRIVGIVLPAILFLFISIELFFATINKRKPELRIKVLSVYFILLVGFIILFWPVLWLNPIHHFIEAMKENSNYGWNGTVLYFGKYISAHDLPRHYLLFWIFVSCPIIYSVLFLTGIVYHLKTFVLKPIDFIKEKKNEIAILIWFFLPLSAVVLFGSVAFDTGRHMYFINGAFVLIAIYGVRTVHTLFHKKKTLFYLFNFILIFSLADVTYKMIKIHPYEHLYFNRALGNDMNKIKDNFEMDYWGLSSREVLEHILMTDKSKKISICSEDFPGIINSEILLPEQRKRIIYTDTVELAKYFFTNHRAPVQKYIFGKKEYYSAMLGNASLSTVFKEANRKQLYYEIAGKELLDSKNDFDTKKQNWTYNHIIQLSGKTHSGNAVSFVDSTTEFGDCYTLSTDCIIRNKKNLVLKTSFWKYETMPNSDAKLIVSIESPDGKPYFYYVLNEIKTNDKIPFKQWTRIVGVAALPIIKSKENVIKIYLWNVGKKLIYIDDMDFQFVQEAD